MKKIIIFAVVLMLSGCSAVSENTAVLTSEPVVTEQTENTEAISTVEFEYALAIDGVYIKKYTGTDSSAFIPAEVDGKAVVRIDAEVVNGTAVTELTLSEGIVDVPMFSGDIEILNLPSTIEIVNPLMECKSLKEINIAENACYKSEDGILYTADGKTLVAYPSGREGSFEIPAWVETIGSYAFCNSRASAVTISDTVRIIDDYAFENAGIDEILIPPSVEAIGFGAFKGSMLKTAEFSEGLKRIGDFAFEKTLVLSVYLPASLEKCGNDLFNPAARVSASFPHEGLEYLCSLKNIEFRDENHLHRAFRLAEAQYDLRDGKGKIFVDLNGDKFPEMIDFEEYGIAACYYDNESEGWDLIAYLDKRFAYGCPKYYICYDETDSSYTWYSDAYIIHGDQAGSTADYLNQRIIKMKKDGFEVDWISIDTATENLYDNYVDVTALSPVKILDFNTVLDDYGVGDKNFRIILGPFASEIYSENAETVPLVIDGEEITEFPDIYLYTP